MGTPQSRIVIVRRPPATMPDGVDRELAHRQWRGYVDALGDHGWLIVEADPVEHQPLGVFVGEVLAVVGRRALTAADPDDERRDEIRSAAQTARALGLSVHEWEGEGRFDASDVIDAGKAVYLGRSAGTDAEGLERAGALVRSWVPNGTTVVPVTGTARLSGAMSVLPDGTVVGDPARLDGFPFPGPFVEAPEPRGATVVPLDRKTVLVSAEAPLTAELLRARGLQVVTVPIGEYERLGGTLATLSARIR